MAKITSITKAQAARFPEWVEKYIQLGLSTEPADFDAATAAALRAYELCNLGKPMVVLRMGSPYAATVGGCIAWAMLREIAGNKVGSQVRSQVGSQVRSQVGSQVWSQVGSQVWSQVWSQVRSQVWSAMNNDRGGAFWASWIAYVAFMRDVLGWNDPVLERFEIDETLAKSCGWVWWHENVLAISDRPSVIRRDDQGRLHCADGPAIAYRDGWAIHAVHGVVVPSDIIESPQSITVERIGKEGNAEIRRVMIERYGASRYLIDSGANIVHRDAVGLLYRKEVADDEPIVMVRVLNSTAEPDGVMSRNEAIAIFGDAAKAAVAAPADSRWKEYMIRVPPTLRTAHEAVAWTFGLTAEQYHPAIES